MRILCLLALFFTAATTDVLGQNGQRPGALPEGRIAGTVVDDETSEPVISATVALWSAQDSSLVTGTLSMEDGAFELSGIRPGQYYLEVSFVGYRTHTATDLAIAPSSLQLELGDIRLSMDTAQLSEVEVTGERSFVEMQVDRTVYSTRDQIASTGGSATDVLRNIPSIEVDADNKVSLRGNQNVAVLINGRPAPVSGDALAGFLQGMSASNIDRVEIMPNPSARYDPDGMGGIINIILKENTQRGLNGNVSLAAATHSNYNGSGNVNFMRGKLNLFGTYGFRYGTRDSWGTAYRENKFRDPLTILDQDGSDDFSNYSHMFNGTADYRLSKYNTLSYSTLLSFRPGEGFSDVLYLELDDAGAQLLSTGRTSASEMAGNNMEHKVTFRRVLEASRDEWTAEVRYAQDNNDNTANFAEAITDFQDDPEAVNNVLELNETDAKTNQGHLQFDYVRPMGEKGKIEAGYKGTIRLLDNSFYAAADSSDGLGMVADLTRNNTFAYDEQVHGAYGIVQQSFGLVDVQVGVRAEQALTTFDLMNDTRGAYDNDYFSLFPSAFFTFKPNLARQVKLSYSKRINRPNTWALNPFQVRQDKYTVFMGNPELKPEYIHSVELGFTQFGEGYSLTATPFFRRTLNEVTRWPVLRDDGIYELTFKNFDSSNSYGFESIGTFQIPRRMNAFVAFNGYRAVTSGTNIETNLSHRAFTWNTRANATFNVTSTLDVQVSYFYRAPMKIPYGRIGAFTMADFAVRQKLFGNKGSVSLRVSDLFDTMGFEILREDSNSLERMNRGWTSRMAHLSFTYNFGQQGQGGQRPRPDVNAQPGQDMPALPY